MEVNIGGEGVENGLVGELGMEVMGWVVMRVMVVEGEVLGNLGEGDEVANSWAAEHGDVGDKH